MAGHSPLVTNASLRGPFLGVWDQSQRSGPPTTSLPAVHLRSRTTSDLGAVGLLADGVVAGLAAGRSALALLALQRLPHLRLEVLVGACLAVGRGHRSSS